MQWRTYNLVLERMVEQEKEQELTSMDILRNLINPKMELYTGIVYP